MSSTRHDANQINRKVVYAILALALGLVAAVLIGARVMFTQVAQQPVALPQLPSPQADSEACATFVQALPDTVAGFKRADLAEPAPAGAAAWQRSSTERVTLRCGVDVPMQYNAYSATEVVGGAEWLRVDDPASDMTTWFTVDRAPVVAVTSEASLNAVDDIDVSSLAQADVAPNPAPLAQLDSAPTDACGQLLDNAPQELTQGFMLFDAPVTPNTLVWTKAGSDPVVLRCGVTPPESYAPGAGLVQINDIPWFEDVETGAFYALGRATDVAVSMPLTGGNDIITALTELIAREVPSSQPAQ